jgi:hypothetical protein
MSEAYPICPICQCKTRQNKSLFECFNNYSTHWYATHARPFPSGTSEVIREFTIGFDIWYTCKENKFLYNILDSPWVEIIDDKLTIMDLYRKIVNMKAYL